MSDANRIAEIDGMLKYLRENPETRNASSIREGLMTERTRLTMPSFGYDVDADGTRIATGTKRALLASDALIAIAQDLADDELNGSGLAYKSVVITIQEKTQPAG